MAAAAAAVTLTNEEGHTPLFRGIAELMYRVRNERGCRGHSQHRHDPVCGGKQHAFFQKCGYLLLVTLLHVRHNFFRVLDEPGVSNQVGCTRNKGRSVQGDDKQARRGHVVFWHKTWGALPLQ